MMKNQRLYFNSIFFRFSFAIIVVLLISFLALICITSALINYNYTDLRTDELTYIARSAREAVEDRYRQFLRFHPDGSFWDDDGDALRDLLSELTDSSSTFIVLCDSDGNVKCVDRSAPELQSFSISDDFRKEKVGLDVWEDEGRLGIFSEDHFYSVLDVYFYTEHIGTVYVCIPVSIVKQPIRTIIAVIVYVSIGVMGVALLALYLVSKRITNPLAKMSAAARAFAEGDFSVRVPITGYDEVSDFARVFNEMAESLENTDKTRNDFVANVSHDLRSPMTSINGFIDGMLSGVIPPEQHAHYLRVVLNETKRLSRLVTTLLDISRIQAGERKFKMMNFDICEMTRQILFSFENRIEEKNLNVEFDMNAEHLFVLADMDAIYQVLYNLCDNAVKFSKENGTLRLSVKEKNGKVTVSVYNEGQGISEEDLKFVFDRFYKADKSRGIDKSGTGLGLYISKKIIEAHKETIYAESEYQKSCTFSFTLQKGENTGRRYHAK